MTWPDRLTPSSNSWKFQLETNSNHISDPDDCFSATLIFPWSAFVTPPLRLVYNSFSAFSLTRSFSDSLSISICWLAGQLKEKSQFEINGLFAPIANLEPRTAFLVFEKLSMENQGSVPSSLKALLTNVINFHPKYLLIEEDLCALSLLERF